DVGPLHRKGRELQLPAEAKLFPDRKNIFNECTHLHRQGTRLPLPLPGKRGCAMSLYPILWAVEHAPVVDAEERAILVALVSKGDFDGCNCYRAYATLAKAARVDKRTAMRKVQAMTARGLIREQPGPKPKAWLKLPKDKRPVVREVMVPASFWSAVQLEEINGQREERGRTPITPESRPDLPEAPPKKSRADKGRPNPR